MIPNYLEDVKAAKAKYPEAWSHAHVAGDPKRWDFIRLLAADLFAKDQKVGLNGKRGNENDLSMDALNYLCDEGDSDGRTPDGTPCAVIDVIASAGIPSQSPAWNPYTTAVEGSGAWVLPGDLPEPGPEPGPEPEPMYPTYEDLGGDEGGKQISRAMEADYKRAGRPGLDGDCGAWMQRTAYDFLVGICPTVDASIAKHRPEWCAELGVPVI